MGRGLRRVATVVAAVVGFTAPAHVAYAVGPTATSVTPADGTTTRERPTTVTATYPEPVSTAPAFAATITLSRSGSSVAGAVSYRDGNRTVVFTPSATPADGVYTATATARDADLPTEPGTTTWTFTVDTTGPPAASIDALPTVNAATAAAVRVAGNAPGAATVHVAVRDGGGHVAERLATRDGDRYTADLDLRPLDDGLLAVTVTAADAVGNTTVSGTSVTKDTTAPGRASTTPPDGATAGAVKRVTVVWNENVGPDATLEVRDADDLPRAGTTRVDGRTVVLTLDAAVGAAGSPYTVVARATDTAGNPATTTTTFTVQPPGSGTVVCGTLPGGVTTWAASGAPYLICPEGVTVPPSGVLELDGSLGPFAVRATGSGGLHVDGGAVRTVGTHADAAVTFDSPAGTAGSWAGISETVRSTVHYPSALARLDLSYVVVRYAVVGISGRFGDGMETTPQPIVLDHVTVTDTSSDGIAFYANAVRITASSVARTGGDGIHLDCWYRRTTPTEHGNVVGPPTVTGTTVDAAAHVGIDVASCSGPTLTDNVVTGSGLTSPTRPAMAVTAWGHRDWDAPSVHLGTLVARNTGAGNAVDAIAVAGLQRGSLTWLTPSNAPTPHPLGYLNLGLTVDGPQAVFPPGSVVKSASALGVDVRATGLRSGHLDLRTATTTVGAGSVLTSMSDDSVGPPTCTSVYAPDCAPGRADWSGVIADGHVTLTDTRLAHAARCLRPSVVYVTNLPKPTVVATRLLAHSCEEGLLVGDLTMTGSTVRDMGGSDIANYGRGVEAHGTVVVTDSTFARTDGAGLRVEPDERDPSTARIERVSLDRTGGVEVVSGWGTGYVDPVVRDVTATRGHGWALRIEGRRLNVGPSRSIDRLRGGDNTHDAVVFNASFAGDVDWVPEVSRGDVHALGYAGSFEMLGGTLRASGGGTMAIGTVRLVGGTLSLTGMTVAAATYANPDYYDGALPPDTRLFVEKGANGERPRVLLSGVTWRGFGWSYTEGAAAAPYVRIAGSTFGVREPVDRVNCCNSWVTWPGADVEISRSTFEHMDLHVTGRLRLTDSVLTWAGPRTGGVAVSGPGDYEISRTRIRGNQSYSASPGIRVGQGAEVLGSCNSITGTASGVLAVAATTDDSDLYGNGIDAESYGKINARRVWWGQSGGPRAGQTKGSVDASSPAAAQRPSATITTSSTAARPDGSYGAGPMTVRLTFSRRMDTRVQPTVTVTGADGRRHRVTGSWQSTGVWSGTYQVGSHNAGGRNTVEARDARGCVNDPATNLMTPARKDVRFATPPAARITSGPTSYSASSVSFGFTADTPASFQCSLNGAAWRACSSPVRFTGLRAGTATFQVRATDTNGTGSTATRTWTVDTAAPTVRMSAPTTPFQIGSAIGAAWSASDATSGVHSTDVRYRKAAHGSAFGAFAYPSSWQRTTLRAAALAVSPGATLCWSVRGRDRVGNLSAWSAERCAARALDDRAVSASGSWRRETGAAYWNSTATSTSANGATLTLGGVTARRVGLVATRCPTCGTVAAYVGSTYVGTIDLRAASTVRGAVVWLARTGTLSGTLTLRVTSAGRLVEVDGVGVSRS